MYNMKKTIKLICFLIRFYYSVCFVVGEGRNFIYDLDQTGEVFTGKSHKHLRFVPFICLEPCRLFLTICKLLLLEKDDTMIGFVISH